MTVAVNVSGRDLVDSRFADDIGRWLAEYGVDPSHLQVEITEGTILSERVRAQSVLTRLNGLGATIAVDDFGTGYSSLGQLRSLPIDVLKIDKSFVLNMETEPGMLRSCARRSISRTASVSRPSPRASRPTKRLCSWPPSAATSSRVRHLEAPPAADLTAWLRSNGGHMSFGREAEVRRCARRSGRR